MFRTMVGPHAVDLGYHSPNPMYDGQSPTGSMATCPYGPCYYGGSGLNAEPVMEGFFEHGQEFVWRKLEEFYIDTFGELK